MNYQHGQIEEKWQKKWEQEETFKTLDTRDKPRFYALVEFPYPSGEGLHVGHPRPYTALDVVSRKRRLEGYNVLFPMGWDAFGLPTENYAIKNNIHPRIVTEKNVARFTKQIKSIGLSFDWSREINTTDPKYYKWTQWIFLQMFKKGLAYKAKMPVNWCTGCEVVLANEEVIDGRCERCDSEVVQREKSQWMLAITKYADRLIDDLEFVEYPERVKASQINWIGRSTGMDAIFGTTAGDSMTVFTTRPDTLFGVTYMVLSPEHPFLDNWKNIISNMDEVREYQIKASKKSDFERAELAKDKTGVRLEGVAAINPVNGEELPIFISDYVLMTYGTGAIMAVPGHDTRDWEFATEFNLPIVEVVQGGTIEKEAFVNIDKGTMINSGFLNELSVADAKVKISQWLISEGKGEEKVNYKLRDWVFSRQRYWGEPIPIVYCETCGYVPLPEESLPLILPEVPSYKPGKGGESPLASLDEWVNTTCPTCGGAGKRETDTMPQWAGSSWYFLRYIDPHNDQALASPEAIQYWTPVDWYNGGMEHTTLHLLYSRFWYKFLYDIGVVPNKEPYTKRTSHGMILASNGEKMAKSSPEGVVNPDDIIREQGADTLRLYEMFIGDFEKSAAWNPKAMRGCRRYLERVYGLQNNIVSGDEYSKELETMMHQTIRKVTEDIEGTKFNTAIAQLMTLQNKIEDVKQLTSAEYRTYLILLNPFAPHLTEELWEKNGFSGQIAHTTWPVYDPEKCVEDEIEIALQINGRIRGRVTIPNGTSKEEMLKIARETPEMQSHMDGKEVLKEIVVPNRLVNIVVK